MYQLWSPSTSTTSAGGRPGSTSWLVPRWKWYRPGNARSCSAGVELGLGIDDVQLALGPEALEHPCRGLAPQRPDLDDPAGTDRVDHRRDDVVPELVHPQAALPR